MNVPAPSPPRAPIGPSPGAHSGKLPQSILDCSGSFSLSRLLFLTGAFWGHLPEKHPCVRLFFRGKPAEMVQMSEGWMEVARVEGRRRPCRRSGGETESPEQRREAVTSVWPAQHFSNLFDGDPRSDVHLTVRSSMFMPTHTYTPLKQSLHEMETSGISYSVLFYLKIPGRDPLN